MLKVLKNGIHSTIQDGGRIGFRKFGIPKSGAMDLHSFKLANWLVNNDKNTSCLECLLKGGVYEFTQTAIIAITGADMGANLNNKDCPMNKSLTVQAGDVLKFSYAKSGKCTYIAIQGKPDIPLVFGSTSTYTLSEFGGLEGRTLRVGDSLHWKNEKPKNPNRSIPEHLIHHFHKKQILRILLGPEWGQFSPIDHKKLEISTYTIQADSDRMGIRLQGETLLYTSKAPMPSSATLPGSIQVPANGQPIILMQDGQTTGGYPRIAKVIDADLDTLAQMPTGGIIRFRQVTVKEARELALHKEARLAGFEA